MNWLHFALYLSGIYMLYYLALIFYDTAKIRYQPGDTSLPELVFSEDIQPIMVTPSRQDAPPGSPPPVIATGGVSIKDIYGLARKEMIVFTQAVGF